jgi:hypothetical protein
MKIYTIGVKLIPVVILAGLLIFASEAAADTSALISSLMNSLNVTEDQAAGGAGAIFSAAKDNMAPQDFSTVLKALPGIDRLMAAAPAVGGSSTGGLTSMLGSMAGSTDTMAGLVQAFSKLGLDSNMVGKFMNTVFEYANSEGGKNVMNLLKDALL